MYKRQVLSLDAIRDGGSMDEAAWLLDTRQRIDLSLIHICAMTVAPIAVLRSSVLNILLLLSFALPEGYN